MKLFDLISPVLLLTTVLAFQNVGRVADSNLTLKWTFTGDYIDVSIEWQQPTFIALMLGDTMIKNDLWLCSLEPGMTEWGIFDRWSVSYSMPLNDTDPKFGGRDDLENKKIEATDKAVFCSFRRKMNTNDPADLVITKGDIIHVCSSKSWTVNIVKHKNSRYCFYWPVLDGFDGELTGEQVTTESSWPLIHGIVMSISWGVLVDFGVSTARYFKLRGLYVISHAVFFAVVSLATIPMAILMIVRNKRDLFYNFETLSWNVQMHFILGVTLVAAVIAQHILGLLTKTAQENTETDKKFFKKRLVHQVVGYSTYVLTKLQMVLGWWIYDGSFQLLAALCVGWAGLLALLHVALEWLYRRNRMFLIRNFQRIDIKAETVSEIKSLLEDAEEMDLVGMINAGRPINEIKEAFPEVQYVLFKNHICHLSGFKHPGGQLLFQKSIGKDVGKYIYGAATLEGQVHHRHRHSEYAIEYLLSRSTGIKRNAAVITSQDWYQREVHQLSKELFKFVFTNPNLSISTNAKDVELYLGKHWLVTSNGEIRPYTILLSQLQCNIEFRTKLIEAYRAGLNEYAFRIQKQDTTSELVLMIKRYPTGKVSRSIHEGVESIQGLYGGGFELQRGLNVVITGGTGILPFLDLFDLLLKKAINTLYLQDHSDQKYDPYQVGYKDILKDMSFKLYASFMTAEEFSNYSWLVDLHLISKKHNMGLFELVVKIPNSQALPKELNRFSEHIGEEYLRQHIPVGSLGKVYVCGPPAMSSSLHTVLERLGYSFLIV